MGMETVPVTKGPRWPGSFTNHVPLGGLNLKSGGGNSDPNVIRGDDGSWNLFLNVGRLPPMDATGTCYSVCRGDPLANNWSPIWSDTRPPIANIALPNGPGTAWQGVEVPCPVKFAGRWWLYHLRKPGTGHVTGKYGRSLMFYSAHADEIHGPYASIGAPVLPITMPWEQPYLNNSGRMDGGLREIAVRNHETSDGSQFLYAWYLADTRVDPDTGQPMGLRTGPSKARRTIGFAWSQDGIEWHKLEDPVFEPEAPGKCQQIDVIPAPGGGYYMALVPEAQQIDLWWSPTGTGMWVEYPDNPIIATDNPATIGNLGGPSLVVDGDLLYCFYHHGPNHWRTNRRELWKDVQVFGAVADLAPAE